MCFAFTSLDTSMDRGTSAADMAERHAVRALYKRLVSDSAFRNTAGRLFSEGTSSGDYSRLEWALIDALDAEMLNVSNARYATLEGPDCGTPLAEALLAQKEQDRSREVTGSLMEAIAGAENRSIDIIFFYRTARALADQSLDLWKLMRLSA